MTTAITINTARIRKLTDLVIANNTTTSNYLDADKLANFDRILITAPATLTHSVVVNVGYDVADDSVLVALQDPAGTDVTLAQGKAIVLPITLPAASISVVSSGNEGGARTFHVFGHVRRGIS